MGWAPPLPTSGGGSGRESINFPPNFPLPPLKRSGAREWETEFGPPKKRGRPTDVEKGGERMRYGGRRTFGKMQKRELVKYYSERLKNNSTFFA